jgi:hypothetical protein
MQFVFFNGSGTNFCKIPCDGQIYVKSMEKTSDLYLCNVGIFTSRLALAAKLVAHF